MAAPWEPLAAAAASLLADAVTAATSGRSAAGAGRAASRAAAAAAALRREAKALQAPHTFAACAKLERRAMALEREAERLTAVEVGRRGGRGEGGWVERHGNQGTARPPSHRVPPQAAAAASPIAKAAATLKLVVLVALVIRWWGVPVATLPGVPAWPLGRWLASPHGRRPSFAGGGVAVLPWVAAVRAAGAAVGRVVAAAR